MAKRDFTRLAQKAFSIPLALEEEQIAERTEREGPRVGTQRLLNTRLIDLHRIQPDPEQVRQLGKDKKNLEEITQSIRRHGVLHPITVYYDEEEDVYRIITGERRYLGALEAGRNTIPAMVVERPDERNISLLQLVENLQRENLDPLDEARGMKRLSQEFMLSHKEIAEQLGKSESYVSRTMRLNSLPTSIQEEVVSLRPSKLSKEHLLQVVREKTLEDRIKLWDTIKTEELNVRQARQAVRREQPRSAPHQKTILDDLQKLERHLDQLNIAGWPEEDTGEVIRTLEALQERITKALSMLQE